MPVADANDLAGGFSILSDAVLRLSEHSNARIRGFDAPRDIVLGLRNFQDPSHDAPHVDQIMIDSLAAGRSLPTPENIDTYRKDQLEIRTKSCP